MINNEEEYEEPIEATIHWSDIHDVGAY